MKKIFSIILMVIFIFLLSNQVSATNFVVNSKQILYGMNIDFIDSDLKIDLTTYGDLKVFTLDVLWYDNQYYQSFGMNSKGLYMGIEDIYPNAGPTKNITQKDVDICDFARLALVKYTTVNEVRQFLQKYRVVNRNITSHDFFADKTGDSAVVEAGESGNVIVNGDKKFQVMTNFANSLLLTKNYQDIYSQSSDRYKIAYEDIRDNFDTYDVDKAFVTLDKAKQNGYTVGSLVYDPEKREIFISWNKRYNFVWKVSMDAGTIETYKGFRKPMKMNIDVAGIKSQYLVDYENKDLEEQRVSAEAANMNEQAVISTIQPRVTSNNSVHIVSSVTNPPAATEKIPDTAQPVSENVESVPAFNFDYRIIYIGIPALIVVAGIVAFIINSYKIKRKGQLADYSSAVNEVENPQEDSPGNPPENPS